MPGVRRPLSCVLCTKRTFQNNRRKVSAVLCEHFRHTLAISTSPGDIICNKCYIKNRPESATTSSHHPVQQVLQIDERADPSYVPPVSRPSLPCGSPPTIQLKIPTTPKSHARCLICKKAGPKLLVVSAEARFNAFLTNNIFVKCGSRICPNHLENDLIKTECLKNVSTTDTTFVNRSSLLDLLEKMRQACLRQRGKFSFASLSADEFIEVMGLGKEAFDDLCFYIEGKVRNTPARNLQTSVGVFLFKLKSGVSNKLLSTILGISKSSIRRAISTVRTALMTNFVPLNLGFSHQTREELICQHTRPLANALFTDASGDSQKLILVLDGTYIYIQKSQNFAFQRRSYSLHKGRPLVKPMVIVTTTGYFVSIMGPYLSDARNNDAKILEHLLSHNLEDIKTFVKPEDVFVVDRGFRDSLDLLKDLGIQAEMPCFIEKGAKQMPTSDANASRLVTKIRWVVESANARIKRWKYLSHILPTCQVPYIGDYVRIVCAICNKYLPPLSNSCDLESDRTLAAHMLFLKTQSNELKIRIENEGLDRKRTVWTSITDCALESFPRLTEETLRSLTCGVYQLKQSPGYIQEHLDDALDILVHTEDDSLIQVKLQSRHISSKQYTVWVQFNATAVLAWYCKCRSGSRVVGMCAHCAAVIWYLGFARYRIVSGFGVRDWGEYLLDAAELPESVDSSESESE